MNAKKAEELGFIDGILEDEKLFTDVSGYEFSANSVEMALVNKISARVKPAEPETKTVTEGRNVDELKASLYKKLL